MKTVFITGATAGIGKATAEIFAKNQYHLVITGRRKDRLISLKEELTAKYNTTVTPLCFDVQNKSAVEKAINSLTNNIDILVNNAGLALGKTGIQDGDTQDWDTMIDTNVKGLLYVSQSIIPQMIERKEGHIINLSSTAAKEVYPGGNVYCATKHAVDALTKGMRIDLIKHNIKVTAVSPGMVETEFSNVRFKGDDIKADATYQGFTPLYAKDVADVIFYAATRPAHVNLGDILMTCTAQANSTIVHKD